MFQFSDPFQGAFLECGRIAGDPSLGGTLRSGTSAIERGNELEQLANQSAGYYRHRRPPYGDLCDRETFQISPQFVHRQYVSASGLLAVVTMDDDVQAGHNDGFTAASSGGDVADRCEEVKSLTGPPPGRVLW